MTTVTDKELIKEIKERIGSLDVRDNIERRAYEIALASLEAEPVAWKATFTQIDNEYNTFTALYSDKAEAERWVRLHEIGDFRAEITPLYAAPPAMVVPDEMDLLTCHLDGVTETYADGWNACRATMLHGVKPVSQTYKLNKLSGNSPVTQDSWINCSELMPNDTQWCVVNTEYGYYVQCWSEGQGWLGDDISIPECDVINWMPLPEPPL